MVVSVVLGFAAPRAAGMTAGWLDGHFVETRLESIRLFVAEEKMINTPPTG
jgi:hypothetical protein